MTLFPLLVRFSDNWRALHASFNEFSKGKLKKNLHAVEYIIYSFQSLTWQLQAKSLICFKNRAHLILAWISARNSIDTIMKNRFHPQNKAPQSCLIYLSFTVPLVCRNKQKMTLEVGGKLKKQKTKTEKTHREKCASFLFVYSHFAMKCDAFSMANIVFFFSCSCLYWAIISAFLKSQRNTAK